MRQVTYSIAVSLDGYIAGPDGGLDWLAWSDDAAKLNGEHWRGVNAVLLGRKTFEFASRFGGAGAIAEGAETYLFSRTIDAPPKGVHLVREDAASLTHARDNTWHQTGAWFLIDLNRRRLHHSRFRSW